MKNKIENKIIKKLSAIKDIKKDFYKLWLSKESFQRHIKKRLALSHIRDEYDYIAKTIDCVINANESILAVHKESWSNLCYNKKGDWVVIFNEKGEIMTSYKIEPDSKSFEELHEEIGAKIEKGKINEKVRRAFKELQERY